MRKKVRLSVTLRVECHSSDMPTPTCLVVSPYFPALTASTYGKRLAYFVVSPDAPISRATETRTIAMFTEVIEYAHANHKATGRRKLLSLLIALVFALTIYPGKAHAQIAGDIEVNIPFQFHAGNAKLPAGKYIIRMMDDSDLTVMEITSADGSVSALFDVRQEEANSTPAKSELIFNKYGNRYFLAKLFDEGNPSGSQVIESRYEKRVSKATAEAQAHVPAHHREQRGN
jgi:hypothetical protein